MNQGVKLLDTVALLEDVQAEEVLLKRGEVGAVVEILAPDVYEVEFCDDQGRAYAFASLRGDQLLVLHNQGKESRQELSLAQRRAYMQLPLEERRKCLAAQAEQMAKHYEQEPERTERIAWQGGDIVEP
jgi:Domain of unknown function (DUF4926)